MPLGIEDRIELQAVFSHVPPDGPVAAGIHHQAPERPIRSQAQIDPAMLHLHRAGQHQAGSHGPPQHHGGQIRQAMALPGLLNGVRRRHRHQTDAAPCGRRSHQAVGHGLHHHNAGNVDTGSRVPFSSR